MRPTFKLKLSLSTTFCAVAFYKFKAARICTSRYQTVYKDDSFLDDGKH